MHVRFPYLFGQHPQLFEQRPQFPPVDPKRFVSSAEKMKILLLDAQTVTSKIAASRSFAHNVMEAAQQSKTKEVEKLLSLPGVTNKPIVTYSPTSLTLTFNQKIKAANLKPKLCGLTK